MTSSERARAKPRPTPFFIDCSYRSWRLRLLRADATKEPVTPIRLRDAMDMEEERHPMNIDCAMHENDEDHDSPDKRLYDHLRTCQPDTRPHSQDRQLLNR
jgi:hypothetical protein